MATNHLGLFEVVSKIPLVNLGKRELNFLIKNSYLKSLALLKSKYSSSLTSVDTNGNTFNEIAMEAIAPLFIKNSSGILGIAASLKNWNSTLKNENEVNYFLYKIISKRVDQTITRILKETNPTFNKILNTINVCIKTHDYNKSRYLGTVYILRPNDHHIVGQLIDDQQFDLIPHSYLELKQKHLLDAIFDYIIKDTDFFPAIPLNLLVTKIEHYYSNMLKYYFNRNSSIEMQISMDNAIDLCLIDLKKKLDSFYLARKKLNKEEVINISDAFDNISKDISHGCQPDDLYFYLKDFRTDLSKEEYYKKYHGIMKYLYANLRSDIKHSISL